MTSLKELHLSCDAILAEPVNFDFGEGCPDRWDIIFPDFTGHPKEARAFLEDYGREVDEDADEDEITDEAAELAQEDCADQFAPMMNYYYPLPGYSGRACEDNATKDLGSCVLVEVGGETVLGLAGGGMDFSWDICAAYVALGYYPPLHFCNLPRISGRGTSRGDRLILSACRQSCRIAANWALDTARRLRQSFPAKPSKE